MNSKLKFTVAIVLIVISAIFFTLGIFNADRALYARHHLGDGSASGLLFSGYFCIFIGLICLIFALKILARKLIRDVLNDHDEQKVAKYAVRNRTTVSGTVEPNLQDKQSS
jgi:hypothetical protein